MTVKHRQPASKQRILPPTYLLLALLTMAVLHFLLPLRQVATFPWSLTGIAPLLCGLSLNLEADRRFKQHKTTVKPYESSTSLVTVGVYRISRHPMYLGFVLILFGVAILLGSLSALSVVFAFAVLMEYVFVRMEERMMATTFGDEWLAYKAKVRRWT